MKKTMVLMMAAALMGGQAFAADYKVSDYENKTLTMGEKSSADLLTVDSSAQMTALTYNGSKLTLVYDGSNYLNVKNTASLGANGTIRNFTPTVSAAQKWIDALTAADESQLTLISASSIVVAGTNPYAVQLQGLTRGNTITLTGNTDTLTAQYVGYNTGSLSDGEIGIKLDIQGETKILYLVGKGLTKSPIAPEPATATLSLLALAGLAARRKRR